MKKILFGTTALVAASLATGSASAAEKIKLGVGGSFTWHFGYLSESDGTGEPAANTHKNALGKEAIVEFSGDTQLDNGMTAGVSLELLHEDGSNSDNDGASIYFEGNFGKISLGNKKTVADTMAQGLPDVLAGADVSSPSSYTTFVHGSTNIGQTTAALHGAANDGSAAVDFLFSTAGKNVNKLSYETPQIAGFQAGVSWTPVVGTDPKNSTPADNNSGQWQDGIDMALAYTGEAAGLTYGMTLSYSTAALETNVAGDGYEDLKGGNINLSMAYGGFEFGAAYSKDNRGMEGSFKRENYAVGIAYGQDAWKVNAEYAKVAYDMSNTQPDEEASAYQIGATYALGPGVDVFTGVQWWSLDDATATNDNDATVFHLGTALSF